MLSEYMRSYRLLFLHRKPLPFYPLGGLNVHQVYFLGMHRFQPDSTITEYLILKYPLG